VANRKPNNNANLGIDNVFKIQWLKMTIFYFTSPGNCLAVAKALGGNLYSIPQMKKAGTLFCQDDAIGLVSPIYGFGLPGNVREFLDRVNWHSSYIFAVLTYGNLVGAALLDLKKTGSKLGIDFAYIEKILMVDNYLPGFHMEQQLEKLSIHRVPQAIEEIRNDIQNRTIRILTATLSETLSTRVIQGLTNSFSSPKRAKRFLIHETCTHCGVCVKVCPVMNIKEPAQFQENCIACLGCVHNCPVHAIHLKNEKSAARFRNPDVTLNEIIASNAQN
jgi:ferredoxin